MRRLSCTLLGTLLAFGSAGASATEPQAIEATGTMIIEAASSGGFAFDLPGAAQLPNGGIRILEGSPDMLFVGIAMSHAECYDEGGAALMCLDTAYMRTPSPPYVTEWGAWNTQRGPGPGLEIYVVTDSPVVLEMRWEGLAGSQRITKLGGIRGKFERLPSRCTDGTCGRVEYGGTTHDVGAAGVVLVFARSRKESDRLSAAPIARNAGLAGIVACAYPTSWWDPAASSDPADYPLGCDLSPTSPEGRNNLGWLALGSPSIAGDGGWMVMGDLGASGPVYGGYHGNHSTVEHAGHIVAYGLWLTQSIRPT